MSRKTRRHRAPKIQKYSAKNEARAVRRAEKKARKKNTIYCQQEAEVLKNTSASLFTTMRSWIDADYQNREPTKAIWI